VISQRIARSHISEQVGILGMGLGMKKRMRRQWQIGDWIALRVVRLQVGVGGPFLSRFLDSRGDGLVQTGLC